MRIRSAQMEDCDAIARVCVDTWKSAYRGLINDEYLARMSCRPFSQSYQDLLSGSMEQRFLLVAENDDGCIVGFVLGGPERKGHDQYTGEIYALYVQDDCQGFGTGSALFRKAVENLLFNGHKSFMLWMLAGNPYYGFYEKHGGVPLGPCVFNDFPEPGDTLELVAYGWHVISDGSK